MKRNEFQEIVHEIAGKDYDYKNLGLSLNLESIEKDRETLSIKWVSGGITGGSCWDTKNYPLDSEEEPEFEVLDELLFKVCPSISLLYYRKLCKLIVVDEFEEREYYGNHREYTRKSIKVDDVWNFLNEHNLINNDI